MSNSVAFKNKTEKKLLHGIILLTPSKIYNRIVFYSQRFSYETSRLDCGELLLNDGFLSKKKAHSQQILCALASQSKQSVICGNDN